MEELADYFREQVDVDVPEESLAVLRDFLGDKDSAQWLPVIADELEKLLDPAEDDPVVDEALIQRAIDHAEAQIENEGQIGATQNWQESDESDTAPVESRRADTIDPTNEDEDSSFDPDLSDEESDWRPDRKPDENKDEIRSQRDYEEDTRSDAGWKDAKGLDEIESEVGWRIEGGDEEMNESVLGDAWASDKREAEENHQLASGMVDILKQMRNQFVWHQDIMSLAEHGFPFFDDGHRSWKMRECSLDPDPLAFPHMFRQRYYLVVERLRRDPHYAWWGDLEDLSQLRSFGQSPKLVMSVEQAIGFDDTNPELSGVQVYILGFLKKIHPVEEKENKKKLESFRWSPIQGTWELEDLNSSLALIPDPSFRFEPEFYLDGHLILAQGRYQESPKALILTGLRILNHTNLADLSIEAPLRKFFWPSLSVDNVARISRIAKDLRLLVDSGDAIVSSLARQRWIVINDAAFDDATTYERLQTMFESFESAGADVCRLIEVESALNGGTVVQALPNGFILCGNFSAKFSPAPDSLIHRVLPSGSLWAQRNVAKIEWYEHTWRKFQKLLSGFPRLLKHCRFYLIPGPFDPGLPALPSFPIMGAFYREAVNHLKRIEPNCRITFVGNPLRLCHGLFKIAILRANIFSAMREGRHSFIRPQFGPHQIVRGSEPGADSGAGQKVELQPGGAVWVTKDGMFYPEDTCSRTARSLIGQCHMYPMASPYPKRIISVLTEFDSIFFLDPMPDTLIIADGTSPSGVVDADTCKNLSLSESPPESPTSVSDALELKSANEAPKVLILGTFGGPHGKWAVVDASTGEVGVFEAKIFDRPCWRPAGPKQ